MLPRTLAPWFFVVLLAFGASCRKEPSKGETVAAASSAPSLPSAPSASSAPPAASTPENTLEGLAIARSQDGPWDVRRIDTAGRGLRKRAPEGSGLPTMASPAPARKETATRSFSDGVASPMKAGSTDDNEAFDEFLSFLASWTSRTPKKNRYQQLDVQCRRFIRVVDAKNKPLAAATVRVFGSDRETPSWTAMTYGDGKAPYYRSLARQQQETSIEVTVGGKRMVMDWTGERDVTVAFSEPVSMPREIQLDVLFIIDTTGSMGDEIQQIKSTLLRVTERLRALATDFDLRYGAVLYRDLGDEYLTKTHPFSHDIVAFDRALQQVTAGGGGDMPESLNQALAQAVAMPWREGAAKVAFLIGDAPPHMDYQGDVPYGDSAVRAIGKGLR
ncbi:MAG TPA: vWA domain-containing protein, partial [Polyangiaceae bacterium]|nr:vWA domain-containing protein [Polyangiaceae bacterium]